MNKIHTACVVALTACGVALTVGHLSSPQKPAFQADFTSCEIVREYEDKSVLLDCSGETHGAPEADLEPDPNLSFWEQLRLLSEGGEEYA